VVRGKPLDVHGEELRWSVRQGSRNPCSFEGGAPDTLEPTKALTGL
jgi:hypothetical protein